MKYGFAGNRDIALSLLKFLVEKGYKPSFLIINSNDSEEYNEKLINISQLDSGNIFCIKGNLDIKYLIKYDVDYIFGIHFPYIIKNELLDLPKIGFLNLHPAYLPYNKGWHTPSWAILDDTLYGATLHFMSEEIDEGDIISQQELEILPTHTANSLYKDVLQLEEDVFKKALPKLISLRPTRYKQNSSGTSHNRKDLSKLQEINLDKDVNPRQLIDKLRALTTNDIEEAAYFIEDGKKYRINIEITEG